MCRNGIGGGSYLVSCASQHFFNPKPLRILRVHEPAASADLLYHQKHIKYFSAITLHHLFITLHIFHRLSKYSTWFTNNRFCISALNHGVIIILYNGIIIMLCTSILYTLAPWWVVTLISQPHTLASVLYSDQFHIWLIDSDGQKFLAVRSCLCMHRLDFSLCITHACFYMNNFLSVIIK